MWKGMASYWSLSWSINAMFLAIDLYAVRNAAHVLEKTLGYGTRLAIGLFLKSAIRAHSSQQDADEMITSSQVEIGYQVPAKCVVPQYGSSHVVCSGCLIPARGSQSRLLLIESLGENVMHDV
jgi:hypothetical protein